MCLFIIILLISLFIMIRKVFMLLLFILNFFIIRLLKFLNLFLIFWMFCLYDEVIELEVEFFFIFFFVRCFF